MIERRGLRWYAVLSVIAALVTIGLKGGAYLLTGSVGLLSDALESFVNLIAALVALLALSVAARPADEEHAYGHTKAEYFSSGFEGALIMGAATTIAVLGVNRFIHPRAIDEPSLGLLITGVASSINLVVARVLSKAGKRYESITLEADAQHLMADVWTSLGVIVGVAAAAITGWHRLDAIVAVAVALNVLFAGYRLLRRSMYGLLDTSLPRRRWRPSSRFSSRTPVPASATTRSAPARRERGGSSRSISWCRDTGRCSGATTCWRRSRSRCGWRSREVWWIPISSRSRIRCHGRTPGSSGQRPAATQPLPEVSPVSGSRTSTLQRRSAPAASVCAVPQSRTACSRLSGAPIAGSRPRL